MPNDHFEISKPNLAKRWTVALAYVAFIYATLGVVPTPLAYLRSHGVLRLTLGALFLLCWCGLAAILWSRSRRLWRFTALVAIAGIYALVARRVTSPEEQVHFIQYGLVGVLFVRAVRPSVKTEMAAYVIALALSILAGWIDELLQGQLSNRHYDTRDVILNTVSAVLGLTIYRVIPHQKIGQKPSGP